MFLLCQKLRQRLLIRGDHMECSDLAVFLYQQFSLPKAFVERNLLLKPIRKGHAGHGGRDGVLCHLECQVFEIDLKHIAHDLLAFELFGDNNTGGNVLTGLFRIESKGSVFAGIADKSLTLPETVGAALPAEPDQRPVFRQFGLRRLCDSAAVILEVLLVMLHMGIYQLGKLRKNVHICIPLHIHHSNPISCFFVFEGAFRSGCAFAALR